MEYNTLEVQQQVKKQRVIFKSSQNISVEIICSIVSIVIGGIYLLFIISPILSLFEASGIQSFFRALSSNQIQTSIKISMSTSLTAVFLIFIFSTPVVIALFTMKRNSLARMTEVVLTLPLVFPPAVAGLGLLTAFGRNGVFGKILLHAGAEIVFSPAAVILAQVFVAAAFYTQILGSSLNSIEPEIFEEANIQGAGTVYTFVFIIIPMLKREIIAGLITAWARAFGEFGATIMFAGNVSGKTQTLPLAVYTVMQSDISGASAVSVIIFLISFITLFIVKRYIGKNQL